MSVQQYNPSDPIQVTPEAQAHFLSRLDASQHCGIRLSIKNSGCSGYKYDVQFVDQQQLDALSPADDTVLTLNGEYNIYIDAKALELLTGSHIVLVKEGLNESIEFKNPNVDATCGCGESFSVKS